MQRVLPAERAVLVHLETLGIVLLVFHCVVVSLLALGACQGYLNAHNGTSLNNCLPLQAALRFRAKKIPCIGVIIITRRVFLVNAVFIDSFPQISVRVTPL